MGSNTATDIPIFSAPTPGGELTARFEPFDSIRSGSLLREWRELASAGYFAEPFYQPEWFQGFADSFAAGRNTLLLTVRDAASGVGAALRAVVPLTRERSFFGGIPARTYRGLSGIHSCRYDLVLDQNGSDQILKSIWRTLEQDRSWDVIEAEDVPCDGAFNRLAHEAWGAGYLVGTWPTRRTPILTLPRRGLDPLANCPHHFKSLRNRLKSKLRRLGSEGEVVFERHTADFQAPFKRFLDLESAGWKASNGSAISCSSVTTRFYSEVVEALAERGFLRIYELRLGSKTIAAQLGLAMNGVYYTPKVAYDESFARYSPGQLLNNHVIGDLQREDFRAYDFLGPMADWKAVWASGIREHRNRYIFRPSARGRVLHALTMYGAASLRSLYRRWHGDPQSAKTIGG